MHDNIVQCKVDNDFNGMEQDKECSNSYTINRQSIHGKGGTELGVLMATV